MSEHNFNSLLDAAVDDVLETMFFSQTSGPSHPSSSANDLEVRVVFTGEISGVVEVRVSELSARALAASFLGESEDSLSESQIGQVVSELTNMLCGCIVSRLASSECFDLGTPELFSKSVCTSDTSVRVERSFAVEHGTLTVTLSSSALA